MGSHLLHKNTVSYFFKKKNRHGIGLFRSVFTVSAFLTTNQKEIEDPGF
jgi:hypothetical protein